jgi:hypothetical protein
MLYKVRLKLSASFLTVMFVKAMGPNVITLEAVTAFKGISLGSKNQKLNKESQIEKRCRRNCLQAYVSGVA